MVVIDEQEINTADRAPTPCVFTSFVFSLGVRLVDEVRIAAISAGMWSSSNMISIANSPQSNPCIVMAEVRDWNKGIDALRSKQNLLIFLNIFKCIFFNNMTVF